MRVAAIGECMMELRSAGPRLFALGYGGDTFNTALYLRRLGTSVAYVSALGDDPFSDDIVTLCRDEGIEVDLIRRVPGRVPGLYLIRTDKTGERSFFYWRDAAPVRDLFDADHGADVVDRLTEFDLIYLSGITLSLYSAAHREVLLAALDRARAAGRRICFDGNYRPRGWPDADTARAVFAEALHRVDVAIPTLDDERLLFGDADVAACADRLIAAGVAEIVIKDGRHGCFVAGRDEPTPRRIAVETVVDPVDTTAAGDSFNAGYLGARARGLEPAAAVRSGQRLAAVVICHPGAIIPREVMPSAERLWTVEGHGEAAMEERR